jgi:hypothetical protein
LRTVTVGAAKEVESRVARQATDHILGDIVEACGYGEMSRRPQAVFVFIYPYFFASSKSWNSVNIRRRERLYKQGTVFDRTMTADYSAPLGVSAEIAVFAPNCVSWSECWDGKERRKQSRREKRGLVREILERERV